MTYEEVMAIVEKKIAEMLEREAVKKPSAKIIPFPRRPK